MQLELTLSNGNIFTIEDGQQSKISVEIKEQIVSIKLIK